MEEQIYISSVEVMNLTSCITVSAPERLNYFGNDQGSNACNEVVEFLQV